jgi:hypothetical protein
MARQQPPATSPINTDDKAALRALEATVAGVRGDLQKVAEALTGRGLEGAREEVVRQVHGKLSADLERMRAQLDAAAMGRDPGPDLASLRKALTDLRDELQQGRQRVDELVADVGAARIQSLVNDATEAAANRVYRSEFEGSLKELSQAFVDADERFSQLRAYISEFGPGGLPVVAQERDEARRRVDDQAREIDALRSLTATQQAELDQRATEAVRRQLQGEIDPSVLDRRIREFEERERDLLDRTTLQAANDRLANEKMQLEEELSHWRGLLRADQQARADLGQIEQLRREVQEAEMARTRAERSREDAVKRMNRAQEDARAAQAAEAKAKADAATADSLTRRLDALDGELTHARDALNESRVLNSQLNANNRQLQSDNQRLTNDVTMLRTELDSAREHARREEAERVAEALLAKQHALEAWAERTADQRAAEHRAEADRLRRVLEELKSRVAQVEEALREAARGQREALAEAQGLREQLGNLEAAKNAAIETAWGDCGSRLQRERAALTAEVEAERKRMTRDAEADVLHYKQQAEDQSAAAVAEYNRREALQAETTTFAQQKGVLLAEIEVLEQRLHDYRIKDLPEEERAGQLRVPLFRAKDLHPVGGSLDEAVFLADLHAKITAAGFHFHPRLLHAFHTSLKIADFAPLTVLAGISGTGKSELPRLYADLGGIPFLEIAVQPSWDSPHDIFGFFNYTDGRFKAEPLARLLHQFGSSTDSLGQSPCIVFLDEMNLARVEYYFSEMLSKLEARRSADRHEGADVKLRSSVAVDLGPGGTVHLYLDPRVLFVGTMNNDESTMTLSDKVLDRASTITFPAPRDMKLEKQGKVDRHAGRLAWATWTSWRKDPVDRDIRDKLNRINDIMDDLGRPFGHRMFRAIFAYLANYPGDRDAAWADQLAMKVLPRLRGLECDASSVKGSLERLRGHVPELLARSFDQARSGEFFSFAGARDLYRGEA